MTEYPRPPLLSPPALPGQAWHRAQLYLPEKDIDKALVALIVRAVPVESIYLLGYCTGQGYIESIFMEDGLVDRAAGPRWLLVLVGRDCVQSNRAAEGLLEQVCRAVVPVTVIVLGAVQFSDWLRAGHRFAATVVARAVVLKNVGSVSLGAGALDGAAAPDDQGLKRVDAFLAGADFYRGQQQYPMTAFMLHQATEHALHTILKRGTGLHVNTHHLDRLLRFCALADPAIAAMFPRDTMEDRRLFILLQQAYIDTRYKEGLEVSGEDIGLLMERVKVLRGLVEAM